MEILIISGMSGAGKSRAAICLEDSGYYIVDNLPAEMMVKFAEFCAAAGGRYDRLAFVYDVRAGEPFDRLTGAVEELRRQGLRCRLLFLEADTKTIINRYKETRRSHPLCGDGASIEEAVARERAMLAPVRAQADLVLDTSAFSTAKLRSTLLTLLGGGSGGGLHVTVLSFGFKNGLPPEADLVLDVRFLPNPYYVPELKRLTGLDSAVRDYVMNAAATEEFWRRLTPMVRIPFCLAMRATTGAAPEPVPPPMPAAPAVGTDLWLWRTGWRHTLTRWAFPWRKATGIWGGKCVPHLRSEQKQETMYEQIR